MLDGLTADCFKGIANRNSPLVITVGKNSYAVWKNQYGGISIAIQKDERKEGKLVVSFSADGKDVYKPGQATSLPAAGGLGQKYLSVLEEALKIVEEMKKGPEKADLSSPREPSWQSDAPPIGSESGADSSSGEGLASSDSSMVSEEPPVTPERVGWSDAAIEKLNRDWKANATTKNADANHKILQKLIYDKDITGAQLFSFLKENGIASNGRWFTTPGTSGKTLGDIFMEIRKQSIEAFYFLYENPPSRL